MPIDIAKKKKFEEKDVNDANISKWKTFVKIWHFSFFLYISLYFFLLSIFYFFYII